jgi:dihydropteroate synthase
MMLRAGPYQLQFPGKTLIMGVVNVTPDSFSDGGRFFSTENAVQHALELARQGADILDIGGESTRPKATPVPAAEEMKRIVPVIERLMELVSIPISVDTMKPSVAKEAVRAGASIVNDVAANRQDPAMWETVAQSGAAYVCMHMQGTPENMQENPSYLDVTREVNEFFGERIETLEKHGIGRERVILDPGIGFGKKLEHNLQLLQQLESFTKWGCPLLLGVSRKSFIGKLTGAQSVEERLAGSLACASLGVKAGVNIIRTHDVQATRQAVRMTEAVLGHKEFRE